jgi:hypothetical protein
MASRRDKFCIAGCSLRNLARLIFLPQRSVSLAAASAR